MVAGIKIEAEDIVEKIKVQVNGNKECIIKLKLLQTTSRQTGLAHL